VFESRYAHSNSVQRDCWTSLALYQISGLIARSDHYSHRRPVVYPK
jgi:hypothetical protein